MVLALAFTSNMLYKTFQMRAAIQKTSISLTKLELTLAKFDCILEQARYDKGTDHDND